MQAARLSVWATVLVLALLAPPALAFGPSPAQPDPGERVRFGLFVLLQTGIVPAVVVFHAVVSGWHGHRRGAGAGSHAIPLAWIRPGLAWLLAFALAWVLAPWLGGAALLIGLAVVVLIEGWSWSRDLQPSAGAAPAEPSPASPTPPGPTEVPIVPLVPWLLALFVPAGPLLLGGGIDLPDDAFYSSVSTWEWLRTALFELRNPFWVPGRFGGQSLYAEAMQMLPFYPAAALLLLPTRIGWPLACVLHLVVAACTARSCARALGLGEGAARLAAWGWVLGTVGVAACIEAQTDTFPLIAWLPLILASWERFLSERGGRRVKALLVGAAALAAMLLGGHVRHAAGACSAIGLWFLIRAPGQWPAAAALTVMGLAGGAPAWLPALHEWGEARASGSLMAALAVPPGQHFEIHHLSALFAPRTYVSAREFSVGTTLGACVLLGFRAGGPALRRLGFWLVMLLLAASNPTWGPLRLLVAPLVWTSHPVTILHAMVATLAWAMLGARGFEAWLESGGRVRGPALGALLLGIALPLALVLHRLVDGDRFFHSRTQWDSASAGALCGVAVLGIAVLIVALVRGPWRPRLLVTLVAADLLFFGARAHLAVPSRNLELAARSQVVDAALAAGSVDVRELFWLAPDGLVFVPHRQSGAGDVPVDPGGEALVVEVEGPELQSELLDRPVPVHLAVGRGWPSLSGRARLPSARVVQTIAPLSQALGASAIEGPERWLAIEVRARALLAPSHGVIAQGMALFGVPYAILPSGELVEVPIPGPCRAISAVEVELDAARRVGRLLGADLFDPGRARLLEDPTFARRPLGQPIVSCPHPWSVAVEAPGPAMIAVRVLPHPGWRWRTAAGELLPSSPVDHVSTALAVPGGDYRIEGTFVPPGLIPALWCSLLSGLLGLGLWVRARGPRSPLPETLTPTGLPTEGPRATEA